LVHYATIVTFCLNLDVIKNNVTTQFELVTLRNNFNTWLCRI